MNVLDLIRGSIGRFGRCKMRGLSMIETVAAVALMTLLTVGLGKVSMMALADQDSIDTQYDVLSADAFFADIYSDFHGCVRFNITESPAGNVLLTFDHLDGASNVFGFYPASKDCRKNGVHMFDAQNMIVQGVGNHLIVSIKLPDERLLEMSIFR